MCDGAGGCTGGTNTCDSDTGVPDAGGADTDADGGDTSGDNGCGCRTGGGAAPLPWLAFGLLGLFWRRRSRRARCGRG